MTYKLITSNQAIPCHRQVHGESGGATIHCVVLADGFIIECGSDGYSLERSKLIAAAVNSFGPDQFAFGSNVHK